MRTLALLCVLLVAVSASAAEVLDREAVAGATVTGIYEQPIALVDGVYEGPPFVEGGAARPQVVLLPWLLHTADVDGDGTEEAVAYLEENSGGTGHLLYVAVFERRDDGVVTTAIHDVGDREQIRRSTIEGRTVVLDLIAHGPNDPGCCPSQLQRRRYTLNDAGRLEETREILGEATVDLLDGSAWRLQSFTYRGEPVEAAEVILRTDDRRVFGSAGCNRFEATFTVPRDRELEFGPAIRTKKMCPPPVMQIEDRFLAALSRARQWNFLAGRLALTYVDEDGQLASLVFERP